MDSGHYLNLNQITALKLSWDGERELKTTKSDLLGIALSLCQWRYDEDTDQQSQTE